MPAIAELLQMQPVLQDTTLTSDGYALWICWGGEVDPNITQTLQDYGGLSVLHDSGQSLWFFFTHDVLLALAKLVVWAKFNPLSMIIQAFPASLQVGVGQSLALSLDAALASQNLPTPEPGLKAWVHPRLRAASGNIPGLDFKAAPTPPGMAAEEWTLFSADPRLPYTSSQGWYAILHPLGNPLDRNFQNGWRHMFAEIEHIVQTQKFKYSLNDNYLMIPLDNLRQLRVWIKELLSTFFDVKERTPDNYWPCVSVVVDRRGLNFNNELPQKVNVKWDTLMPDFPYMSYRNAYLLGEEYVIQDLHFSSSNSSIDNWCNVTLASAQHHASSIPILMSGQLVGGSGTGCFYCGVRTHEPGQCPSRKLPAIPADFWQKFSTLDLDDINAAFRSIDQKLTKSGVNGYAPMLSKPDSPEAQVLEAVFAINQNMQLRQVERIWSISGKDITAQPQDSYRDESPAWAMLEHLMRNGPNELAGLERDLTAAINHSPRDWHLRSLMGFVALERGDLPRALSCWHEGESLCTSVLHQAWHCGLQARVMELQMRYTDAMEMYGTALRLLPLWRDAEYRALVCRVKMGFAEQVQNKLIDMVNREPAFFNCLLLDPELERGQKPLLSALYPLWSDAQKQCGTERAELVKVGKELEAWFPADHPLASRLAARVQALLTESNIKNYLAFFSVMKILPQLQEEVQTLIQKEIEELQDKFKNYLSSLEMIRDEASWFPIPRVLVEFNRDFNECAGILNWAFAADFRQPEAFKKAQSYISPLEDLLARLEKKLRLLRVVRDSTLFVLIMVRTFMWIEIVGLTLAFIAVFVLAMYGGSFGMAGLERIVRGNFWELQKVIVGIVSVTALSVASLRTTLVFDRRREQMLEEARQEREAAQRRRLDRIRASREAAQKRMEEFQAKGGEAGKKPIKKFEES